MEEKQYGDVDDDEFLDWLKKHKLLSYQKALEDEGFEMLESLITLTTEEVDSLATAIHMKMGHKKVFHMKIEQDRERHNKDKATREREEEEREEQRRREKTKREREEEEQEEQRKVEQELSKIQREQKLAEAKAQSRKDQQEDQHLPDENPTTRESAGLGMSVSKSKSGSIQLPATKSYAAFISHKKAHSKQGDSSSTLARSLKVRSCEVCICHADPISH